MRRVALLLVLALAACADDDTATTLGYLEDTTSTTIAVGTTGAGSTTTSGDTTATVSTVTTMAATGTTNTQPATGTSVVVTMVGTTMISGAALTANGDVYTIDWDALTGPVVFTPAGGGPDPFFHVHNSPAHDGFFFSVEAYTTYGPDWTGQLGTFAIDCTSTGTGICVHFDPDGNGPMPDLGADYLVTGTAEILQADGDNFIVTFTDVVFSDGSTIPGPFTVSG